VISGLDLIDRNNSRQIAEKLLVRLKTNKQTIANGIYYVLGKRAAEPLDFIRWV
jgi:hypothetical protein